MILWDTLKKNCYFLVLFGTCGLLLGIFFVLLVFLSIFGTFCYFLCTLGYSLVLFGIVGYFLVLLIFFLLFSTFW